ncbi:MAG: hypothetical protein AAF830_15140, partial [Pseudomonadota bacterium]
MIKHLLATATALAFSAQAATAQDVDFSGVQDGVAGGPTEVLVLGTAHLNQLPDEAFDPSHLAIVLKKLEEFQPDVIAIEAIGGFGCSLLLTYGDVFNNAADSYCSDPAPALAGLGMDFPEAARAYWTTIDNGD